MPSDHSSQDNLDAFGKLITSELREKKLDHLVAKLKEQYSALPSIADNGNSGDDFISTLTEKQVSLYLSHVTEIIENVIFNMMRELDEGQISENELIMTINGEDVTNLPLIGNGNLSGEMFDWIKRFSKYPSPLVD